MNLRLSAEGERRFREIDRANRPWQTVRRPPVKALERADGVCARDECGSKTIVWIRPTADQVDKLCSQFYGFPKVVVRLKVDLFNATVRGQLIRQCETCFGLLVRNSRGELKTPFIRPDSSVR